MRILFQGDSITDCGRDRSNPADLGSGYVAEIAKETDHELLNRGVSGNRVYDLEARWTEDCIALKPDFVCILIGINDTWRRYDSNLVSPIEEFEASLDRICQRVSDELAVNMALLEPFLVHVRPELASWREDLDPRIEAIRRVAKKQGAEVVRLDELFTTAAARREPASLAPDGVHPSPAGHVMIAQAVRDTLGL